MKTFFKKVNYLILLFVVVIISYGQILGMYVWQDDNALFFKLANIEGKAGYLGPGPFGEGPYKYTVTPYIPIYKIFGFSTFPYFFFNLALIFLTTVCVYKVFSKVIGNKGGKIAGFLYAAGYIASDGFIRLFNGPITNVSVVLISFIFLSLWNYYKEQKLKWYLFSILFFFLATEFTRARTHYLIGVIVLFELIFLAFKKPLKSVFFSFLRILPFAFIFYEYFIRNADQRSGQVKTFVVLLLKGDFQQLYGFTSSLGNLIFPDWLIDKLFLIRVHNLWIFVPAIVSLIIFVVFRNRKKSVFLTSLFILALTFWTFFSRKIFVTGLLNLGAREIFVAFLGGVSIILFSSLYFFIKNRESKKLYLFLVFWTLLNLLAYAAYSPTVSYASINRYLSHSFFALTGLLAIFAGSIEKSFWKKVVIGMIVFWGLGNLFKAISYQKDIILTRSDPPRKFYSQLKNYIPSVKKGDLFYFDVASNMQSAFTEAFSVAQMPETTAIAWRYGVDRYDLDRVTEFDDLISTVQTKKIPLDSIHSFFYSGGELIDTTASVRNLLAKGGEKVVLDKMLVWKGGSELIVNLTDRMESFTPSELEITLSARIPDISRFRFPYSQDSGAILNKVAQDTGLRKLAFSYKRFIDSFYASVAVQTSSDWQKRVARNLIDQDSGTAWQADRILWSKEKRSSLTLDLKEIQNIGRFVWVNAFGNNTPTKYFISLSFDGAAWREVKSVSSSQRVDTKDPQIVEFEPQPARFVRMTILQSINNDSPGIAEAWVIPAGFSSLDLRETQRFLDKPFAYIPDAESFREILSGIGFKGDIKVAWQSDKEDNWTCGANSKIDTIYDGVERTYKLVIPAGGTGIDKIKLFEMEIPSEIIIRKISVKYPTLKELEKEAKPEMITL